MNYLRLQLLVFTFLLFVAASCTEQPAVASNHSEAPGQLTSTPDTALFYKQLCTALQQRNPTLLLPLLADNVVCRIDDNDRPGNNQKFTRQIVIQRYFRDAQSGVWDKFNVIPRLNGLGAILSSDGFPDHADFIVPQLPPPPADEKQEYAYIFADDVNIRSQPNTSAPVIRKISRSYLPVNTEMLCYDDVDENWLPVLIDKKTVWVSISLTNWDVQMGYMLIGRDKKGQLRITELSYGQTFPDTWFLPGCC